jgi:hypothetical protein
MRRRLPAAVFERPHIGCIQTFPQADSQRKDPAVDGRQLAFVHNHDPTAFSWPRWVGGAGVLEQNVVDSERVQFSGTKAIDSATCATSSESIAS